MTNRPKIALIAVMTVLGACGKSKDGHTPDASKAAVALVEAKSDETAKALEQLAAQKVEAVKDLNRLEGELAEAQKQPNNEAKIAALQASIDARETEIKNIEARAATLRGEIETLQVERKKIIESSLTGVSGEVESSQISIQSTVTLAKNSFHNDTSLMLRLDADRLLVVGIEEEELATAVISATPSTDAKDLVATRIPLKASNGKGRVLDLFDVKLTKDGSILVLARTEIPSAKDATPVKTVELLRLDSKFAITDRKVLSKNEAAESLGTKSALLLTDDTAVWLENGDSTVHVFDAARKTMKGCELPGQTKTLPKRRASFGQIYRTGKQNQIMLLSTLDSSEDLPMADEIVVLTVDSKKVDAKNPCGIEVQSRTGLERTSFTSFNRTKGSYFYQSDLAWSASGTKVVRVDASSKVEATSSDAYRDLSILGDLLVGQSDKNHLERLDATSLETMGSAWNSDLAIDSMTTINEKSGLLLAIGEDTKAYLYDAKGDAVLGAKTLPMLHSMTLKAADEEASTEALQEVHFARASGLRLGEKSDLVPVLVYPTMTGAVPEGTDAHHMGLAKVIFVKIAQ